MSAFSANIDPIVIALSTDNLSWYLPGLTIIVSPLIDLFMAA